MNKQTNTNKQRQNKANLGVNLKTVVLNYYQLFFPKPYSPILNSFHATEMKPEVF